MICVVECLQHGVSFLSFLFLKDKKKKQNKRKTATHILNN